MWISIDALFADVTIGGLTSPLLSWLGSVGLLLFFGWHVTRRFVNAARATTPFLGVRPLLLSLAERSETADLRQAYDRAFSDGNGVVVRNDEPPPEGVDLARLTELDEAMRRIPVLRRPWVQFRKSLLIEHVPWFAEPRIFSTRRAEEFFTREAVLNGRVEPGFYERVPSLITGFGLLLTFVAFCIGLNRLHADGATITGIQGLINGMAGKFLTSVVGLLCANLFLLLERPAMQRLLGVHAEFLTLLDESFPRRTVEDLLDALAQRPTGQAAQDSAERRGPARQTDPSMEQLTAAVSALSDRIQASRESEDVLAAAIRGLEHGHSRAQAEIAKLVDRLAGLARTVAESRPTVGRGTRELRAIVRGRGEGEEWPRRGRHLG